MISTFKELVLKSSESDLISYNYRDGLLSVTLRLYELDDLIVTVQAVTRLVRSSFSKAEELNDRTCYIQLADLTQFLETNEHGIYIPPSVFGNLMKQVRQGYYLAYGQRVRDTPYMLRFVGTMPLLVCLISNINDISWIYNNE